MLRARRRRISSFIAVLFLCFSAQAQQKSLTALKAAQAPRIDGSLDDAAWANAPIASDFIVYQPDFGKPASRKSEVKILYDNTAIYVGAYLYDDPALIRKQLTPRDREQRADVDFFSIALDTYNDNQNGFQFVVTTANVQSDIRLSSSLSGEDNFGIPGDYSWDAVWDSRTSMKADGWVVEMKIPFMALRFAKKPVQDWGIQFQRFVRRDNENTFWNTFNPNINGYVNQFGDLKGLLNIEPPLRLSFQPYITLGGRSSPQLTGGFKGEFIRNGGMDLKYGINESFTLDMTLIPDFGQVISDNVVLNLTPFEVQFQENRPFFTEGVELFNKAGIFYSRRVGAIPGGYFDIIDSVAGNNNLELVKNPGSTQLYNASKFSGRTKNNLGIGIFNAVTAPIYATLKNKTTGDKTRIQTEPLANYNIIVLDQAFKNRSYITFTNTNVLRNGQARDANVSALDVALYNKKNTHSFQAQGRYSRVKEAGEAVKNGYQASLSYSKVSGNLQYYIGSSVITDKYDPNDMGILFFNNQISTDFNISYNHIKPTKRLLNYNYALGISHNVLYKPTRFQDIEIEGRAFWLFKNFWDLTLIGETKPMWYNDFFETRSNNRVMKRQPYWFLGLFGSTDSRKKLFVRYGVGIAESPIPNDPLLILDFGIRYRFSNKFSLELGVKRDHDNGNFGFAFLREPNGEPIIARRRNTQFTNLLTGIYNFTPRMNLSLRARHYWSRVIYDNFYNLDADGYWIDRPFIPGQDQGFNAFNLDVFYTWDFKLGSRIIFAWKNALSPYENIPISQYSKYTGNLGRIFNLPHSNEVSLRFIYFIDYLQLKKKR
jgi:Domain of unknown function (DUF5916)/Carbohydrate family 9 binding domain-like